MNVVLCAPSGAVHRARALLDAVGHQVDAVDRLAALRIRMEEDTVDAAFVTGPIRQLSALLDSVSESTLPTAIIVLVDTPDDADRWLDEGAHEALTLDDLEAWGTERVLRTATALRRSELALHVSQTRLYKAQRVAAVAGLARGVAHEFNNILMVVLGLGQMLADALPPGSVLREDIDSIMKAGSRGESLTRRLLAFARSEVSPAEPTNLNSLIRDMVALLRRIMGEDLEFELALTPRLPDVLVDPARFRRILVDLCMHSREYMPGGGTLKLSTSVREVESGGQHVCIEVTDSGQRPQTTTIDEVPLAGLGLLGARETVHELGGSLSVRSEPRGTITRIEVPEALLPDVVEDTPPPLTGDAPPAAVVLVVEDEAWVRELTIRMITRLGYTPVEATSARHALELVDQRPDINILLADCVMPDVSGGLLAERITAMRPEVRLIMMSGYAQDEQLNQVLNRPGAEFLRKPFDANRLDAMIRRLMN